MLGIDRRLVQNFDWPLFGLILTIVGVGVVNLASATHDDRWISPELYRQLLAISLGGVGMLVVVAIDYRHFERLAIPIFLVSLALLVATLIFAPVTRGSRSWLFGGSLQPSEVAKLALILMLARFFHRNPARDMHALPSLLQLGMIIVLPVGLIVMQGDAGMALLTLFIACTFLVFVRIPWGAWLGIALTGVLGLVTLWMFALAPYQRSRILDVIDPGRDPLASGYQAIQSRIAVGSGGLLGSGYMEGTQTQLRFLPTQHTDFAFSVLGEEWGFVGSTFVLMLYVALMLWGLMVARSAKDGFGGLLAVGVVAVIFWPATLNIAMVLGLAPVIGVALPLLSYGGSAIVITLVSLGLLLNVSMRRYVF
ncbi:rod shape-determining protein RodA [Myxococcota bacterium]|nr:rod shape-determining protein RodA [Myxococcota bacterium]